MRPLIRLASLSASLLVAGCAAGYNYPVQRSVADLKPPQQIQYTKPPTEIFSGMAANRITLEWALDAAISRHPALAVTWYEIQAGQGAMRQAAALPNPRLIAEMEEFGGSGDFSGTGAMSSRIGISQEILLGGKINRRVREAEAYVEIAALEHKAEIYEIRALVERRFFEVFALQERVRLQQEQFDLIEKTHEVVAKRVKTGDTAPLDLSKSRIELASAKIEVERTQRALEAARYAVAESWGSKTPDFTGVTGKYQSGLNVTEEELIKALEQSPAWLLYEAKSVKANAALDLATAERIPDIEFEGGFQRFNESDNHSFFLGVSVPLPLFDRNQGGIAEASATKQKAGYEKAAGCLSLHTKLQEAWRNMTAARGAFRVLEAEVIPAAKITYEAIGKSYRAGEANILALLDAQRTWVETRQSRLDLLHELENSRIEIKRLIGDVATVSAISRADISDDLERN